MRSRRIVPELMDDPALPTAEHVRALRGLARINRITRIDRVFWRAMQTTPLLRQTKSLSVLDVACGGGDLLNRLAGRALAAGWSMRCFGCDINPSALDWTRQHWTHGQRVPLETFVHDAREDLPRDFDVIVCSLFLHHLENQDVLRVLQTMRKHVTVLVLVDDLLRTRRGLALAWIGCQLLSRSRIVHVDGPRSVQAGWRVDEVQAIAERAGLKTATIARHWPERFLLRWSPS